MLYDCFRYACSIELKEMVILTGGTKENKVTVYNNKGFVEDWPELKTGRFNHGCGHFINTDNKVVRHIALLRDDDREKSRGRGQQNSLTVFVLTA